MRRYAVLADDLTGAADAAGAMRRVGMNVRVCLTPRDSWEDGVEVEAWSTGTRSASAEEAYRGVSVHLRSLMSRGATRLFKKIDSMLRGNIVSELSAALDLMPSGTKAIVCPAFPAQGRLVVGGTIVLKNPGEALREGRAEMVADIFEVLDQGGLSPGRLEIAVVASGVNQSRQALLNLPSHISVVVADATSDKELEVLSKAAEAFDPPPLYVGSAPLAGAVAQVWNGYASSNVKRSMTVIAITSQHPKARDQAEYARTVRRLPRIEVDPTTASGGRTEERLSIEQIWEAAIEAGGLILSLARARAQVTGEEAAYALAAATVEACDVVKPTGLILVGGDGAGAVMDQLGVHSLNVVGEAAVGVPISWIIGGQCDGLPVITKSGSFGAPSVLAECMDILQTDWRIGE